MQRCHTGGLVHRCERAVLPPYWIRTNDSSRNQCKWIDMTLWTTFLCICVIYTGLLTALTGHHHVKRHQSHHCIQCNAGSKFWASPLPWPGKLTHLSPPVGRSVCIHVYVYGVVWGGVQCKIRCGTVKGGILFLEVYVSISHRQQQHRAVQQAVRHVSSESLRLLSSTTYTARKQPQCC